jgi:5-hydroxyisourate hydrolase
MAGGINRISTHVLDTALGKPATGVPVRLEYLEKGGRWLAVGSSNTDADGRCAQMLAESEPVAEGLYRLVFDTGSYYAAHHMPGLYPVVEITFQVRQGESQFHIPLLLSPNGYTTYRGS